MRNKIIESFDEDVSLVKLLDVILDFFELMLISLLSPLATRGVNQADMSESLIFLVNLVPLPLQTVSDLLNLFS